LKLFIGERKLLSIGLEKANSLIGLALAVLLAGAN